MGEAKVLTTPKTMSLDAGVDVLEPPTVKSAASLTSLQKLANRYHDRSTSLDAQYDQETQKAAVVISLSYNNAGTKLAASLSDGRTRIVTLPDWTNRAEEQSVNEVVLADKEVLYPNTSPATTTKWCPNKKNMVRFLFIGGKEGWEEDLCRYTNK